MKIQQSSQLRTYPKNYIQENKPSLKNSIQQDCFVKSKNVSFGSDFFLDTLFSFFDELTNEIDKITKLYEKEIYVQALISVLSQKQSRNFLMGQKNLSIESLMERLGPYTVLTEDFKNAGINTTWQLDSFLKTLSKSSATKKAFKGQEFEAIEIYGKLNKKDDLANFGDILLYIYNQEDESNPNYNRLNEYPEFLRELGITKTIDFENKFAHLKPQFNDFEKISDKVDAIDYVKETYNSKITYLEEIVGKDAPKVYSNISDIVDYFYEQNEGKSLNGLENIIEIAIQNNKFKSQSLKQFITTSEFETTSDKVNFYEFLKECDVTVSEFNDISKKSFIVPEDNDIFLQLANKKHVSDCIAQIKGTEKEDGSLLYTKFSDVINAVYDDEKGNTNNLEILISLIDKLNIKNSDGILRLYQEATGDKKKTITASELSDFISLFAFADAKTVMDTAKKQKVTAISLLKAEKEKFTKIEEAIEDFVTTEESAFFAGQSALSIYKTYYDLFQDNSESVANILQNIIDFNISNSEQYQQKSRELAEFGRYFEDKDSLIKFIHNNGINFEAEDSTYKENCLSILNSIYDTNNPEKTKEIIDYYSNSGFLLKSQNRLAEFLEKLPENEQKREILSLIADKKVPSINQLERFYKQYNLSNISGLNLMHFLANLPEDVDFTKGVQIIDKLQTEITRRNLPLQITAENIGTIDIEAIKNKEKISTEDIISIMNRMYKAPENGNFLSVMQTTQKEKHQQYQAKKIAEEIVFKMNSSNESYQNLIRLLGLRKADLGLQEDASEYLQIKAIQEKLPNEFVDFVNSDEWLNLSNDSNQISPSLILHARLRAIDRFALENAYSIEKLYTQETKQKLQNLFKSIYIDAPIDIKGTDRTKRIITNHKHNGNVIEAVFSPTGTMITVVQKRI